MAAEMAGVKHGGLPYSCVLSACGCVNNDLFEVLELLCWQGDPVAAGRGAKIRESMKQLLNSTRGKHLERLLRTCHVR